MRVVIRKLFVTIKKTINYRTVLFLIVSKTNYTKLWLAKIVLSKVEFQNTILKSTIIYKLKLYL